MFKKVLLGLAVLAALVALGLWLSVRSIQGPEIPQGETSLSFTEVPVDWTHETDLDTALPFMAAATIDVDGDGTEEVFIGGGTGQKDVLLQFSASGFTPHPRSADFADSDSAPTYGATSLDATGDGRIDLFVAREDGVWFYENTAEGLSGRRIEFDIAENTAPMGIALSDVDGDGWVDLYVSGYIKIPFVEGETIFNREYGGYSYLLRNNGDNTWQDVSRQAGVWRQHNTFTAAFIDLDRDRDADLVVAQDTGKVELYANNKGLFGLLPPSPEFAYPMGLGFGDYDNNGLIDLYFSNVGSTLPSALVRGDLRDDQVLNEDYILLRNNGKLSFSDEARATGAASHGFGWGVVVHDMNLDGRQDLLIAQNYARFPAVEFLDLYNCRLLQQYEDGTFQPVEEAAGVANPYFAMTPLVADFNGDGQPDLLWANLTGTPKAFINDGTGNHWLAVRLPDTTASLGAIVEVELPDGTVLTDTFSTSEGLGSDQTPVLRFGLGNATEVAYVDVDYLNGETRRIENPAVDTLLTVER